MLRTGADALAALLESQIERRRRGELPIVDADAAWTLPIEGVDPRGRGPAPVARRRL